MKRIQNTGIAPKKSRGDSKKAANKNNTQRSKDRKTTIGRKRTILN